MTWYRDHIQRQQGSMLNQSEMLFNMPFQNQFNGDDARHCTFFGCGKYLTLTEKLCGHVCLQHMGNTKMDINLVIKYG